MKANSSKNVFLILLTLFALCTSCSRKTGVEEISGVYVCKYEYKYCNSLDYLVLYKDSTYKRVFTQGQDSLFNYGTWNVDQYTLGSGILKTSITSVGFYQWIEYGLEKNFFEKYKKNISTNTVVMKYQKGLLVYLSDININFTKLDSLSMIEYGIVEKTLNK